MAKIRTEERKLYEKEYRIKNRDKINLYNRAYNKNNRDKRRKIEIKWRTSNPDKVAEYNKKSGAKWAKNNAGLKNAITAKRRSALKHRTVPWADQNKIKSFYLEAAKMTRETGVSHEVDHILPLQGRTVSGLHVENNLQIIPRRDNRRKKNCL